MKKPLQTKQRFDLPHINACRSVYFVEINSIPFNIVYYFLHALSSCPISMSPASKSAKLNRNGSLIDTTEDVI